MTENVLQVRGVVLFACEAHQSFIIDVDAKRVDRGDGDVDAEVPFEAIDKDRFGDILLYNAGRLACASWHFIEAADHLDSFALRRCLRLHDPELASLLPHLILQLLVLLGAVEAAGHEVEVLIAVEGLHSRVALVEAILPCDFVAAREVIYALKPAQVTVNVRLYCASTPDQDDRVRIEEVAVALVRNV